MEKLKGGDDDDDDERALKECFAILMRSSSESVGRCIDQLLATISKPGE